LNNGVTSIAPDDPGQDHQHRRQRGQAADLLGDAHRNRRGDRLGRERGERLPARSQRVGDPNARDHGGDRAREQRRQHRQDRPADGAGVQIQWDRKRNRRGAEQEMDELRALEVGRIVAAGGGEHAHQQQDSDGDRIDQRVLARALEELMGAEVGEQGRGQPKER
jgi:hypothetical protein